MRFLQRSHLGRSLRKAWFCKPYADVLTGIPDRRILARWYASEATRQGAVLAILNLAGFRKINQVHGYRQGDAVLRELAGRLRKAVLPAEGLCRLGGDEFGVCLPAKNAKERLRVLLDCVSMPVRVAGIPRVIPAVIGAASHSGIEGDHSAWLRRADIALQEAKRHGGICFFDIGMGRHLEERRLISRALWHSLVNDSLKVYYQPIIDLARGRVAGFEALARLHDEALGWISPARFIAIAEEDGMIARLSERLLFLACGEARSWPDSLTLSFNISALELSDASTAERILTVLSECRFPPTRLEIEVTESAMITHADTANAILATLRNHGVTIAIDDFGTGYSGMAQLSMLPVDRLKLDRSFVARIGDDRQHRVIRAIIALGHELGMRIVAEGIETPQQLAMLCEDGCDFGQGYLFGKPRAQCGVSRLDSQLSKA